MKELTIEQKAKAYDEALKRTKSWVKGEYPECFTEAQKTAEFIFPELKESEDDRIRKELTEFLKKASGGFLDSTIQCKTFRKWCAWLEKQGGPNPYSGVSFEYNDHAWGMCARDGGVEVLMDGNLKAFISSDKSFIFPQPTLTPKSALEAAKEEKIDNQNCVNPTDKNEPEFHGGEWVIYNHDICQIVKREEGCNKLVTVFGIEKELVNERNLSTAHLWTIQDAKAGDVLACGEEILLFKSYSVQGRISLYCWYNGQTNNFHNKEVVDILLTTRNKVCPTTKEQRDLLFSKMKEAGYEWDAEKKKLKKIDDEEVNGEDYGIDGLWHAKRILEKTLGSVSGYQTDDGILDHKAAITAVKKLYEQKPTWTEEDGKKLSDILAILRCGENCYYNSHILIDWLKSLKERIGG